MSRVLTLLVVYLGIDVAKDKLDVVMRCEGKEKHRVFANTPSGFEQLQRWLQSLHVCQVVACLEATGSYSDAVALFLSQQAYTVSVLNPAVLVAYRASKQQRSKTDQADAALLARYASEEPPVPFQPLPAEVSTLRLLLQRRDDLKTMIGQERNRLHAQRLTPSTQQEIEEHLLWLNERLKRLHQHIWTHIEQHPLLARPFQRLVSIRGVGAISAAYFVAHIGEIERFAKAGTLVSLAGLAVKEHTSGKTVYAPARIDRHGRRELRSMLYMCAMVSLRCDPAMQQWAHRLRARGKPTKVIMVAVMRKLLHIIYGVWKHDCDYDPSLAFARVA